MTESHEPAGLCPLCWHQLDTHAVEAGHRVCTRGYGRVSCQECAHGQALLSLQRFGKDVAEGVAAGVRRGQTLRMPRSFALARPVIDGWTVSGGMFGSSTS
ncbi:hypothetical protein [Streptomyces sp. Root369]|uniref:hypothetical protein n=1 Tax=Streptomyces sp. Root369 TaxID=1736523 RepID=UPI00070DCC0A|nr:hypothetical protein [Streptomyces sp. Root369]KQW11391.1 hypothetical protein ASD08_35540 [Streptomyces sp. Root369]